jgi:hypothetical protein
LELGLDARQRQYTHQRWGTQLNHWAIRQPVPTKYGQHNNTLAQRAQPSSRRGLEVLYIDAIFQDIQVILMIPKHGPRQLLCSLPFALLSLPALNIPFLLPTLLLLLP